MPSQFDTPVAAKCVYHGNIFVLENGANRVTILDAPGRVRRFGQQGMSGDRLSQPTDSEFSDCFGKQVLVADHANHCIVLWSARGE